MPKVNEFRARKLLLLNELKDKLLKAYPDKSDKILFWCERIEKTLKQFRPSKISSYVFTVSDAAREFPEFNVLIPKLEEIKEIRVRPRGEVVKGGSVTFFAPKEMIVKLDELARSLNVNKAVIIRKALDIYLTYYQQLQFIKGLKGFNDEKEVIEFLLKLWGGKGV
jgi:predicted transcriptional regulator